MIAAAPTNRLRWLACLPTRMLAGLLLVAVLMGSPPAPDTAHQSATPGAAASATQQSPDDTDRAETTEQAATGPVAAPIAVRWRPIEHVRSKALASRLVQRGPPSA